MTLPLDKNQYWSQSVEEVFSTFSTTENGLTAEDAADRLEKYGPNSIAEAEPVNPWDIWWRQFHSLIVALLVIAAIISAIVGDIPECIAIVVVVVINALIGFFTELRATQSMAALKKLSQMTARVVRGGNPEQVTSEKLVPGDWVVLEAGDLVPADIRIVEANLLQSDESALTGESLPIRKSTKPVNHETPLAERKSMLYRGAKITAGTGGGIVVGTGLNSELGKISEMVSGAAHQVTPLEKQLDRLGYRLVWVTLALMAVLTLFGLLKGIDLFVMLQTAIALAIAAIPEGLPIVATIALANGLWKMASKNAVINHLSAVETLGSTGIICTDKTGTLTKNRMTVSALWPAGSNDFFTITETTELSEPIEKMMRASTLCNNAALSENGAVGDPLEVALLEWTDSINSKWADFSRLREIPFDAAVRRMTTVSRDGDKEIHISVKGASEALLPLCRFSDGEPGPEDWEKRNLEMASQGLRVIAVAEKVTAKGDEELDKDLRFLGLIGLIDPPRPEVAAAIKESQSAGIRIVMITGDQAATAKAVAEQIGIKNGEVLTGSELEEIDFDSPAGAEQLRKTNIIARCTPSQKLSLVKYFQAQGEIVAMTGDGVNDAPALKQADIGVAMGKRGTDVAREVSSMVLQDDSFSSIVVAIRQGRVILSNIRKFVLYLMSCNLSEILVVWIAMMFSNHLPLLPLQILFLNLVTDVFPALALGVTPGSSDLMKQPPRKAGERILQREHWVKIVLYGLLIAAATLGAFLFALREMGKTPSEAITISFLTLAIAQLFHVFNMAELRLENHFTLNEIIRNRWVWRALGLCLVLLALACYVPLFADILSLRAPGLVDLIVVIGFGSLPLLAETIRKIVIVDLARLPKD